MALATHIVVAVCSRVGGYCLSLMGKVMVLYILI